MWDVVGPSACRMKLRLPSQQKVICVRKEATVAQLVEYVKHTEKELQGKEIELLTGARWGRRAGMRCRWRRRWRS